MIPFTTLRRSVRYAALLTIALIAQLAAQSQNCFVNARIKKITANVSPAIRSYMEYKPVDYNTNPTKKYALLVYIGGTGEMFQQPGGSDQDLCPVLQYSMPWRMNVGHFPDYVTDPATGQQYSYLVVMPFVRNWEEQYSIDPGAMIDYALQAYANRIDVNRIYLTGMSRGTDNLMGYVTASTANANRIAAIVPAANCFPANVGTPAFNTQVNNLAAGNVRMWGISCQGDKPCPEIYMKNWVDTLNKLKPGNARFSYAVVACDTAGPNASFHYAWNQAYDPDYRPAPHNKNVYEWMIQFSKTGANPPPPPAENPNCSTIVATAGANAIKIKGLNAPVVTVQIFNSSWATVHNQVYNNPDSVNVTSLPNGTYNVKVNFYNSGWSAICNTMLSVTIGASEPPPPPPPPPPAGTPNCNNVTASSITGGIKLKGLIAPVVVVQVFNSSWATVYNRSFTNSPDSINITPLPNGAYNVKVSFSNASWAPVCERIISISAGGAAPGAAMDTRSMTVPQAAYDPAVVQATDIPRYMTAGPNPFRKSLTVTIGSAKMQQATITIIDLAGRQLFNKPVVLQQGINRFNLDGLGNYRPGTYILRLTTKEGMENLKVVRGE